MPIRLTNLRGRLVSIVKAGLFGFGYLFIRWWAVAPAKKPIFSADSPVRLLYVVVAYRGDLLLNFPAINAIKRHLPNCEISCWVNTYNAELARTNLNISEVIDYKPVRSTMFRILRSVLFSDEHDQLRIKIESARFDVLVDDSGGFFTSLMGWRCGIPFRIGRNGQGFGFLNHVSVPADPEGNLLQKRLPMIKPLGIESYVESDFSAAHVEVADEVRVSAFSKLGINQNSFRYITVQPFAGWRAKDWTIAGFSEVLNAFCAEHELTPILIGSIEDVGRIRELSRNLVVKSMIAAGNCTLVESMAVIRNSQFHLGVDSFASHVAALNGVKSLTIFGPTNPFKIARVSAMNAVIRKLTSCTPSPDRLYCCYDAGRSCPRNGCLEELQPRHVFEAMSEVWNGVNAKPVYEH